MIVAERRLRAISWRPVEVKRQVFSRAWRKRTEVSQSVCMRALCVSLATSSEQPRRTDKRGACERPEWKRKKVQT